jgi:cytochrome P450
METRKSQKNNQKHVDFLQLMMNARKKDNVEEYEEKSIETNDSIYEFSDNLQIDKSKSKFEISDMDILATAFLFFNAGYETTSTLLTFLCYSLAINQDCQQKLYEELKSAEKLDYETILKLPYLDACIAETQRLYTSIALTSRVPSENYKLGIENINFQLLCIFKCYKRFRKYRNNNS